MTYSSEYYQRNKEKLLARQQEYYEAHKEERKAYQRVAGKEYRETHKEQASARSKKWRTNNPEKSKEACRKHRLKDPEATSEYQKNWRADHQEEVKGYHKKSHENHPDTRSRCGKAWREKNPDYMKNYEANYRERRKELYSNKRAEVLYWYSDGTMQCGICGEKHLEFLSIDHINGGGGKHRKTISEHIYAWLIKNEFPEGYRVLCHCCNQETANPKKVIRPEAELTPRQKYRQREYVKHNRQHDKLDVFNRYCNGSPHCMCKGCTETNPDRLCIDHIDGGGNQYKKDNKIGNIYKWIIENGFPADIRVLCHNCNQSLGFYGYCPHEQ